MKIFLIGFMGSGKTTLGKYAAKHLGLGFMDLDQLIEANVGLSIPDMFREKSEQFFRETERDVLREVCDAEGDYLVSCGGGTPCWFDNMERMNKSGITIYLDISSARLTDRIRKSKSQRPLLQNVKGDLQIHIHKLLLERTKFYSQARVMIPEEKANKKDILEIIRSLLPSAE